MNYIAIDIGSSFVKSALIDPLGGVVLAQHKEPAPQRLAQSDHSLFEIPAQKLLDIVRGLIDRYAKEDSEASAVLLSTQMHGFVYQTPEREDTYVSWQDMRCLHPLFDGRSAMERLQQRFSRKAMCDCGVYIKPSLGLCNLYAMLEQNPTIPRDGELFTIGSYIIGGLTGRNICHLSNAAPLGIADVRHGCWKLDLLEAVGLSAIRLPDIADSDFVPCGYFSYASRQIAVYPDFGDQQVSILGSMATAGEAVINIATGSQVSITTEEFVPGDYETRPYFEGRYINTISNMPAGRNLDVLIQFLRGATCKITGQEISADQVWQGIGEISLLASDGIEVDMGFYSTPGHLNGGAIRGIAPQNLTLCSLFSAALEDMANTYWRNIEILRANQPVHRLVCAGGVSWKTPALLHAIEQLSGRPCRLSALPDEALSGLFRIALVCDGICKTLDERPDLTLKMKEGTQ